MFRPSAEGCDQFVTGRGVSHEANQENPLILGGCVDAGENLDIPHAWEFFKDPGDDQLSGAATGAVDQNATIIGMVGGRQQGQKGQKLQTNESRQTLQWAEGRER